MKEKSQKKKKGSSKKTVVVTIIILLILAIAIICGVVYMNTPKEKSEDVLAKYFSLLNEKNYTELYSLISSESKMKYSSYWEPIQFLTFYLNTHFKDDI